MIRALLLVLLLEQTSPLEQAWKLAGEGDRAGAERVLKTLLISDASNADAQILLGSLLAEHGDRDEAIAQLQAATRLLPKSGEAWNALGEAYRQFGEKPRAREAFLKAVTANPALGIAQSNLGEAQLEAGEAKAAAMHLARAVALLKRRPDLAEAWSALGQARRTQLDEKGAIAAFEKAAALEPEDATVQYRLGAEYLRQEQPAKAVGPLEKANRIKGGDQSTLNALAAALRQTGRTHEAASIRKELAEVLRKRDDGSQNALNALKLNNEGVELEKAGKTSAAADCYRRALELNPEHVGMRVNYAVALLRLGRWRDGLNQMHDALEREPENEKIRAALKDAIAQAPKSEVPEWAQTRQNQFLR